MDAYGDHDLSGRLSRRRFFQSSMAAAAMLALPPGGAQAITYLPPKAFPFASTTPENRRIPSGEPLDPNSDAIREMLISAARIQRVLRARECTVYEPSFTHPYYAVLHRGLTLRYNGVPLRWRVPPTAQAGINTDNALLLQEELGHPLFGPRVRLRGWRTTIDHTARALDALNWSVCNYSRSGDPTPVFGTTQRADGVYVATGSGREWVGLVRPDELSWALKYGGRVAWPNVTNLKQAIRHAVRATLGVNLHLPDRRFRAPATQSDASGTGLLEMGMRLRLDPTMSDAEILERVPAKVPAGNAPDGRPWAERWQIMLWIVLFAIRDYGLIVADRTADNLIALQFEDEITAGWGTILGPESVPYGELFRDGNANSTDGGTRPANAGLPLDRLQVLARSTF